MRDNTHENGIYLPVALCITIEHERIYEVNIRKEYILNN